jgi:uncharacterized membrane protein YkvA (DUF1232 family)
MYFYDFLKKMLRLLKSRNVPLKDKLPIVLMLVYIISPIDLIPFPILGFSILDDIVVFILLSNIVKKTLSKYNISENGNNIDPEHIINNVDYEVSEDKKTEQ